MFYTDANELIERVLEGEDPEDVLDSIDEDMYVADLLAVEYLNPYLQEWETIDEIDEELLGEIEDWDYRECDLDEDEFYEKSSRLKKYYALRRPAGRSFGNPRSGKNSSQLPGSILSNSL